MITKNETRVSSLATSRTMWDRALATGGFRQRMDVEIRSCSISRRERGRRRGGVRHAHELLEEWPYPWYIAYAYDVTWRV